MQPGACPGNCDDLIPTIEPDEKELSGPEDTEGVSARDSVNISVARGEHKVFATRSGRHAEMSNH